MSNKSLIESFLKSYQGRNAREMAVCYRPQAHFEDIAFRLDGRPQIYAMWHLVCANKKLRVDVISVEEKSSNEVVAEIVVHYEFPSDADPPESARMVINRITSRFEFSDGLIAIHTDECDAADWGRQAMGGVKGFVAGHVNLVRRRAAKKKLQSHLEKNPGLLADTP